MTPIETVNSLYDAFKRRDMGFILSKVSAGCVFHGPPSVPWGGNYVGPDGAKAYFGQMAAAFEISRLTATETLSDGSAVVVLGSFEGKGRTSGRPGATDFCHVWKIRDGMVDGYVGYFDTAAVNNAIG